MRTEQRYRFFNESKGVVLAASGKIADDLVSRMRGLLFAEPIKPGEGGLLLSPCHSIHMLFMTYAIDALFLDKNGVVVAILQRIKPWQVSAMYPSAHDCLELPPGTASDTGTAVGDKIVWRPEGELMPVQPLTLGRRIFNLLSFGYLSFLVLWCLSALKLFTQLGSARELVSYVEKGCFWYSDFFAYLCAWTAAGCGPGSAYSADTQSVAVMLLSGFSPIQWTPEICSPVLLLFLSALRKLHLDASFLLSVTLLVSVAFCAFVMMLRERREPSIAQRAAILAGIFSSFPFWLAVRNANVDLFSFAALALFVLFALKRRPIVAGAVLSLAVVQPIVFLYLIAALLGERKWKMASIAVLTAAALFAGGAFYIGQSAAQQYIAAVFSPDPRTISSSLYLMPSWIPLLGAIASFALAAARARSNRLDLSMSIACAIILSLVLNTSVSSVDMMLLAFPAALLLRGTTVFEGAGDAGFAEKMLNGVYLIVPLLSVATFVWYEALLQHQPSLLLMSWIVVPAVVLASCIGWLATERAAEPG